MPTTTAVPGTVATVARATGITSWAGAVSAVQTVNAVYLASLPWNGSAGAWTNGISTYLYVSNFGFAFTGTDTLVSITASLVVAAPWPGLISPDAGVSLDTVQLYNGSTLGTPNNQAVITPSTDHTYTFSSWGVSPTIAQINNANFGLLIGASGTYLDAPPMTSANAPSVSIDQIQIQITTTATGGNPPPGVSPGQYNTLRAYPQIGQILMPGQRRN